MAHAYSGRIGESSHGGYCHLDFTRYRVAHEAHDSGSHSDHAGRGLVAIQESLGRSCCSESGRRIILLNTFFFYFLSAIAVGSAILMVTRRNIAEAAIFLVTALLATAGIFLQLQSEFLFIVQVFLYAGGIMMLFVFAIMPLHLEPEARLAKFNRSQVIAATLAVVLGAQILYAVFVGRSSLRLPAL